MDSYVAQTVRPVFSTTLLSVTILVQSKDKCTPQIKNTSSIYLGPASCFWLLTFSSLSKSIIWSQPITDCLLNPIISVPPTTTYTILLLYNQWSASSEDFKQPLCNNYPAAINILIHCACVKSGGKTGEGSGIWTSLSSRSGDGRSLNPQKLYSVFTQVVGELVMLWLHHNY